MRRLFRKRFWVWAVSILAVLAVVWSLPPVRVEYHKWRLQALKKKKEDYTFKGLSGIANMWAEVSGRPVDIPQLNRSIQGHEDALVKLGFLRRERFVAETGATEPAREALAALSRECPWQHVEIASGTNLVLTACARGMEQWRKRAEELGWKCEASARAGEVSLRFD